MPIHPHSGLQTNMMYNTLLHRHGLWLFVFCVSVYLLTMGGHLYSADNEIKGMIAEGIVERHSVALPEVSMMYMVPGRDGLSYAYFPIGSSITMIPFYLIGNLISQVIPGLPRSLVLEFCYAMINSLVAALTCIVLFAICRRLRYSIRTAIATSLIYGFCTIAWPYAKTAWSEPQAILCVLTAFYCILRFLDRNRYSWIILAGLAVGYGITTKYEMGLYAFLLAGLMIAYLKQERASWRHVIMVGLAYGIPLAIFGFLILYYNYLRFEGWFDFGYYTDVQNHLEPTSPVLDSFEGFIVGIYQHLFSSGKSILLFSPPLILFYWAMKRFWHTHRKEALFCLAVPFVFFVSAGTSWQMTFMAWGERYFVTFTPFLILPLSALLEDIIEHQSAYMKKSIITFAAIGMCIQILGVAVNFQTTSDKLLEAGDRFDIQTLSYDPEYSPVLLNFKELFGYFSGTWQLMVKGPERMAATLSSADSLTLSDFDKKKHRDIIRYHTFDFWFCYMYFVKFSGVLILFPLSLLIGLVLVSGRMLYRIGWQCSA